MKPDVPTLDESLLADAMFLRTRDPADHEDFDAVLPHCTPLAFWTDDRGNTFLRWSMPMGVASSIGYDGGCDCCGTKAAVTSPERVLVDTLYDEVAFYFA